MKTKLYREPGQIDEDLLPEVDYVPRDARGRAIVDVLCRIPDLDHRLLLQRFEKISWFVPDAESLALFDYFDAQVDFQMKLGECWSPPSKLAFVLYLAPALERVPADLLRGIVAAKLAHVLLKHEMVIRLDDESAARERDERSRMLRRWGLEEEKACRDPVPERQA